MDFRDIFVAIFDFVGYLLTFGAYGAFYGGAIGAAIGAYMFKKKYRCQKK